MPVAQSRTLGTAAAAPEAAAKHLEAKLSLETDPWDVHEDMKNGVANFVLVDARSPESFAKEHAKGAVNLWHRHIDEAAVAAYAKDTVFITYCTGIGCNASAKGALKLARLGFKVKEMVGGLEWWKKDGFPTEGA